VKKSELAIDVGLAKQAISHIHNSKLVRSSTPKHIGNSGCCEPAALCVPVEHFIKLRDNCVSLHQTLESFVGSEAAASCQTVNTDLIEETNGE